MVEFWHNVDKSVKYRAKKVGMRMHPRIPAFGASSHNGPTVLYNHGSKQG